jgi:hypothetical protein
LSWYGLAFPWSTIALTSFYCDGVCFALFLFRLQICRPYTGRTHQLRLHLQHLGHPIANDPNYGGDMWYGNPSGRHAAQIAQQRLDGIHQVIPKQAETEQVCQATSSSTTVLSLDKPATEAEVQSNISPSVQRTTESKDAFIRRTCVWCARMRRHQPQIDHAEQEDRIMWEFLIRSPGIWLHALQYSFLASNKSVQKYNDDNGSRLESIQQEYQSFRVPLPAWHDI